MNTIQNKNKATVRSLYEDFLNKHKLGELSAIIADDYANDRGGKGIEAFQKQVQELLKAIPDAQWEVKDIIAEGDKVIVRQEVRGTQTGTFQGIMPTGKTFVNEGTGFYELKDGKIVHSHTQTDRLGFLQQLGLVPTDVATLQKHTVGMQAVYFVDKFFIPAGSLHEFTERMNYNRNFIHSLAGFVQDEVMQQQDADGNYIVITVATWENKEYVDKAKSLVAAEYQRIQFDPSAFYQRLNIKMERGLYSSLAK
ncbi:ester cyclase [Chitinophagaceae bacterium MMS25-I14]